MGWCLHGMVVMWRLSVWISGMVLSGRRQTANLWGEKESRGKQKSRSLFDAHSLVSHTDLFQRAGGPHQFVDHVDGDPHEGGEADEVPHRDAPVGILVVEQCQLRRLQEGADDDKLRRGGT